MQKDRGRNLNKIPDIFLMLCQNFRLKILWQIFPSIHGKYSTIGQFSQKKWQILPSIHGKYSIIRKFCQKMWQILPSIHGKYSEFLRSKNMPNVATNPGIVANCGEIFSPHCPEISPQCHLQEQRFLGCITLILEMEG